MSSAALFIVQLQAPAVAPTREPQTQCCIPTTTRNVVSRTEAYRVPHDRYWKAEPWGVSFSTNGATIAKASQLI